MFMRKTNAIHSFQTFENFLEYFYDLYHSRPVLEYFYDLYHSQPEMMNFIFSNKVDHVDSSWNTTEIQAVDIWDKANVIVNSVAHEEREVLSQKLTRKNHECDILSKQLFDKSQMVKILTDRVSNLEDENWYRLEVVSLEGLLDEKLRATRQMEEIYEKENNDKITWLERVIEEREDDIENWKEDLGNAKA